MLLLLLLLLLLVLLPSLNPALTSVKPHRLCPLQLFVFPSVIVKCLHTMPRANNIVRLDIFLLRRVFIKASLEDPVMQNATSKN